MNHDNKKAPYLEEIFCLEGELTDIVLVGDSPKVGRRQLVITGEGKVTGRINGRGLPGGVDCQLIRPDGITEVSAKYGIELDNGDSFLVINEGIRRAPQDSIEAVKKGAIPDPEKSYFITTPRFEVYSEDLKWLTEFIFICQASRKKSMVVLRFFKVNIN